MVVLGYRATTTSILLANSRVLSYANCGKERRLKDLVDKTKIIDLVELLHHREWLPLEGLQAAHDVDASGRQHILLYAKGLSQGNHLRHASLHGLHLVRGVGRWVKTPYKNIRFK